MYPIRTGLLAVLLCLFTVVPVLGQQNESRVEMETSLGNIILALDSQSAPQTVENFLSYVKSGFYDNTIFHRVIKSFMIQGGGLTVDMQKKQPRAAIKNEADNGLKNKIGTIAMARTSAPHSATAQFFINVADNASLDHKNKSSRGWGYCVFGRVVEGMAVVRAIEKVNTTVRSGRRDVPAIPVVIKKVSLMTANPKAKRVPRRFQGHSICFLRSLPVGDKMDGKGRALSPPAIASLRLP